MSMGLARMCLSLVYLAWSSFLSSSILGAMEERRHEEARDISSGVIRLKRIYNF
jgi:hypothetical protein